MEIAKRFVSTFMPTISNCALYSRDHVSVDNLTRKLLSILDEFFAEAESLELMIVDNSIVINKTPLRDLGLHGTNLIKRLKRKGISRVDITKGVTHSELKQFVADIAEPDKRLKTYPHIKTGVVDVRLGGSETRSDLESFRSEQVQKVKEIYDTIAPNKKLNITELERIVVDFIVTFRQEANILQLISPVKAYSEYTYTHATNVAILSMSQAEALGARDELLHDIGIAALLHDVGKLFISKEILEKTGKLNDREWEEIRMHPLYGARYLAKIDGLTHLAPIVAIEHHMRYDCLGYPGFKATGKKQHFCSQIVATSDFFDALRSRRPYKRDWAVEEIVALMKKNAGSEFNPFLVDKFLKTVLSAVKK